MAVAKMRKLGQDDSEEQKPLNKLKDIGSAIGNTARTFLMPEAVPEGERVYQDSEGPVPPSQTPAPPNAWYQSYGRYASPKMMPMYDEGGDVMPNPMALSPDAFDPSAANAVGQSAVDSAAGAAPESGLHKTEDAIGRAGAAMDDPSSMPGQTANTKQYGVQGLDRNYMAPMYDDGGLVKTADRMSKIGSVVAPDDDSAKGIAAKKANIEEYENATQPKEEPVAQEQKMLPVDRVYPKGKGNYGDRPGEKRMDVSSWIKPIGAPMYDDGGPVKNDPNDGHHQMAVLEEGERVLTPEQNAQYEQEHGAPADFGGRVLQQPNPPVRPMMDTERETQEPVGGAKMDTSNPPAAEVEPAMMRTMSNTAKPAAPALRPFHEEAPAPSPTAMPAGSASPDAANAVGQSAMTQPEHNAMATSASAKPLPNEREKLESERAALKQKMVDAAEGKNNNGKFDHIAYGEAKMALADLNKAHPWGQPGNHEGMLGKIGHGLAVAGELASDAVMGPGFTAAIPGTRENLMQQEAQGQQQITQGLGQKASEAETGLKEAQTGVIGKPKDPKQGIAFESFNAAHTAPGTPEHQRALDNLAFYQAQDKEMNANKQASKPSTLPLEITAQTKKVLSLPKGSPERAQAEEDLKYMEQQAQASGKLTDRHREIIDYAVQHGLDPEDQDQYAQATMGYEKTKTAAKAEGGLPVWKTKAQIQNELATERALLVQANANANQYGVKGAELQQKADADFGNSISSFNSIKNILATADENTVASNVIPMLTTLGIVSTEGKVKRLNKSEYEALSPARGSLYRWAAAHADRLAAGQLPDGYKEDVNHLMDQLIKEQRDVYNTTTEAINKNFGEHAQQANVTPTKKGGTTVTPEKAKPTPPATENNKPAAGGTISPAEWLKQRKAQQPQ